jgi:hypothetical protein
MFKLLTSSTLPMRVLISLLIALIYNFVVSTDSILSFLIFFPLLGSFVIAYLPSEKKP